MKCGLWNVKTFIIIIIISCSTNPSYSQLVVDRKKWGVWYGQRQRTWPKTKAAFFLCIAKFWEASIRQICLWIWQQDCPRKQRCAPSSCWLRRSAPCTTSMTSLMLLTTLSPSWPKEKYPSTFNDPVSPPFNFTFCCWDLVHHCLLAYCLMFLDCSMFWSLVLFFFSFSLFKLFDKPVSIMCLRFEFA